MSCRFKLIPGIWNSTCLVSFWGVLLVAPEDRLSLRLKWHELRAQGLSSRRVHGWNIPCGCADKLFAKVSKDERCHTLSIHHSTAIKLVHQIDTYHMLRMFMTASFQRREERSLHVTDTPLWHSLSGLVGRERRAPPPQAPGSTKATNQTTKIPTPMILRILRKVKPFFLQMVDAWMVLPFIQLLYSMSAPLLLVRYHLIYAVGNPMPLPEGDDRWNAATALLRVLHDSERFWDSTHKNTLRIHDVPVSKCFLNAKIA